MQLEGWMLSIQMRRRQLIARVPDPWEDAFLGVFETARKFIAAEEYEAFLAACARRREISGFKPLPADWPGLL